MSTYPYIIWENGVTRAVRSRRGLVVESLSNDSLGVSGWHPVNQDVTAIVLAEVVGELLSRMKLAQGHMDESNVSDRHREGARSRDQLADAYSILDIPISKPGKGGQVVASFVKKEK